MYNLLIYRNLRVHEALSKGISAEWWLETGVEWTFLQPRLIAKIRL